jgi:hypothetical protein
VNTLSLHDALPISHSRKFCAPEGTNEARRVAKRTNNIIATTTITELTIEFVTHE